jgi:hypothetical protein
VEKVLACGELVSNRRDKLFQARAELKNEAGLVLATATGKYLPIKQTDMIQMVTDFVEEPNWVFGAEA